MVKQRKGYNNLGEIPDLIIDGVKRCINCKGKLPKRRKRYCSDKCSNEMFVKNNHSALRTKLIYQNKGVCTRCKNVMTIKRIRKWFTIEEFRSEYEKRAIEINDDYALVINFSQYILDHIIPIACGGSEFDEKNLQILCLKCNKIKTREDMKKITIVRRKEKLKKIGQKSMQEFINTMEY